jgi:hypothetical protein
VVAYDTKGTMTYIDNRLQQQPMMVVAVAYIDSRRRQWPVPTTEVLIMTRRGGSSRGTGGECTGEGGIREAHSGIN